MDSLLFPKPALATSLLAFIVSNSLFYGSMNFLELTDNFSNVITCNLVLIMGKIMLLKEILHLKFSIN